MLNRSAKPSGLPRLRCKGVRVHCSWTNLSGSPTQRRSALPVGAVRVTAGAIGLVDGVAGLRAGGATLGGDDVLVSEGRVVSAHREASSERPGRALVGGCACQTRAS